MKDVYGSGNTTKDRYLVSLNQWYNNSTHKSQWLSLLYVQHQKKIVSDNTKEEIFLGYVTLGGYVTTRKKESALNWYYQRTSTFSYVPLISVQNDLHLSVLTILHV